MKTFKLINVIAGWVIFTISATVYLMTMEPTVSFWDCGEFISTASKLEVGHPPGNPVFMLIQNLFSHIAGGDKSHIAFWVNTWSAICSALTTMFLFWSITHLARKIKIKSEEDYTQLNLYAIIGSGAIGAMAFAFSDSFWFSAVEGVVWPSSTFIIALVFWAILKWENVADEKGANRWLILIAYIIGLSIGIHLLNILAIPAIVLVYYFRKYEYSRRGLILALLVAIGVLAFVMYVWIRGLIKISFWFELLFVNGFGLPYDSGMFFFFGVLMLAFIWGIRYTYVRKKLLANTALTMLTVMLIGYSCYGVILIRASANPPLNENNPSNPDNLLYYLSRKQYGETPLISGQYYNAPVIDYIKGSPIYIPQNGRYEIVGYNQGYKFDPEFTAPFSRMWSDDARHVEGYKRWGEVKGTPMRRQNAQGKMETIYKPTFGENLRYFINYQMGFMYWRYFMWNFVGRQNDIQGSGEKVNGNWLSGIKFIDEARLGTQDNLPPDMANNRARNKYYFLPLILGLIGLYFHLKKHPKDFSVVAFMFFMTGMAIVLYLNQKPYEPRERDYSYVASFYAFSIWIGLGLLGLIDYVPKKFPKTISIFLLFIICFAAVPGLMARENWDDHNRSGRYTARDFAANYLNSCAPNAILFTNGDNDTFPLWYCQEVEGIRTDVRVVNLSYLGADWYIEQMSRKVYNSDPLPISMKPSQYVNGRRDIVYLVDQYKEAVPLKDAIEFIKSDDPKTKQPGSSGEQIAYLPVKSFTIPIDKEQILKTGTVRPAYAGRIASQMKWKVERGHLLKNDMMILDILANNNWKRPVYFAVTVGRENYVNLDNYFQLEGLTYRVVPVNTPGDYTHLGYVDADIMYDNMMNKFKWGGITNPNVYLDENNIRMLSNFRNNFGRLAEALVAEGKTDSAKKVLDKCMEVLPAERVPHNFFSLPIVELYYKLNQPEKAAKLAIEIANMAEAELSYFLKLNKRFAAEGDYEKRVDFYLLSQLNAMATAHDQKDMAKDFEARINKYNQFTMPNQK
jgi:MFS family permease